MSIRGLIIKKEWLDLILSGEKTIELRSRMTNIRGRILLVESGSGMIMGACNIIDCVEYFTLASFEHQKPRHHAHAGFWGRYKYGWCIEIGSEKRFSTPIPYNHPQGAVIWVKFGESDFGIEL